MANQSINLNLIPSGIAEVARVSQFDVGRVLTFAIYQGTDIFTPPSGTSIEVHVQKGDKKICIYTDSDGSGAVSLSGSTITLTTTLQMAAASGEATLQFRLKKNGQDIGTLNCSMMVQRDPAADGDISDSELPAIIDQASEQMERAEAAALAASNSAEAAATSATTAGTAANNAAQAATRAENVSLHPAYIGQNGNWYTYDLATDQYKDSGIAARGTAGNGIQNIQKTGTSGLVDSYRINYTNGGYFDYTVTNGKDGAGGVSSVNNVAPVQGNVTLTKSNIGLGNVDNTADANKSVAKATGDQSGNNIKASYGASLSYSNNVLSLLNKNGGVISSQTIQAGGVTIEYIGLYEAPWNSTDRRASLEISRSPKYKGYLFGMTPYSHSTRILNFALGTEYVVFYCVIVNDSCNFVGTGSLYVQPNSLSFEAKENDSSAISRTGGASIVLYGVNY